MLISCNTAMSADQKLPLRITVAAGDVERIDTPISVELGGALPEQVRLVEIKGGQQVPTAAQVEKSTPNRLHFMLSGRTAKNASRVFELSAGQGAAGPQVAVSRDEKTLSVKIGEKPVLQYNHAPVPPPPGKNPLFTRSGFFHPLWSPSGFVLTNIHPADHIHHLGLWNPWTNTTFEGRNVDFWNIGDGKGTVRFVKFNGSESGPVFGSFSANVEHVDLKAPGGEKVALNEKLDIRVWNIAEGGYLFDFVTTQRCASQSALVLNQYRYGGFGFRATAAWKNPKSDLLTSEGKHRRNGNHTRAKWVNVFGPAGQGDAGVIFMSNPQNREYPEPIRVWATESDMFVNFSPTVLKSWTLEPGNDYTLRYRVFMYDGKLDAAAAERLWQDFGNPPKVTIEAK